MSADELDRERLAKLIGLSTSNEDGEVLSATRKANALIRANRTTWTEVILQPVAELLARHPDAFDEGAP